ncbi:MULTISPECIES: hypothetical protein [unclassified Streptomyces]|uniref:hypothetical protein n=1 Tax=unclassified Streptomyces TaxID=2593676 RepID=UPI0037A33F10
MITTIADHGAAVAAARAFSEHTGPLATLADGTVPECFARLRLRLADLRSDAMATLAMLGQSDEPDDPMDVLSTQEVSAITAQVAGLRAWVETQECRTSVCECRADRLLRALLEDQTVDVRSGYRPADRRRQRRPVALMAGFRSVPASGSRPPYVLVDFRGNIAHAVRLHRGWRARLIVDGEITPVYVSPGYPDAPVGRYREDTQACAVAVAAALEH